MKKNLIPFFFLVNTVVCAQYDPAFNAQSSPILPLTDEQVDLIYQKTKLFPNQTQLSIAFISGNNVDYYGIIRNNDSICTSVNSKDIYEIGSITKAFTSTLLAQMTLETKVQLEDYIDDYLSYPIKEKRKITFQSLANHTSGLPRLPDNLDLERVPQDNPYRDYDEGMLKTYLTSLVSIPERDSLTSQYSNLGFGLLGTVLAKIEDKSYPELLKDRIFSKYQMDHSTADRSTIKEGLVQGLDPLGRKTSNWDMNSMAGAGAILSNVEDLSKFVLAQFDPANEALTLTRQKTFHLFNNLYSGLAWVIIDRTAEAYWYSHNGGTGGYTSSFLMDVENRKGIIILSNLSAFSPLMINIDQLAYELMSSMSKE